MKLTKQEKYGHKQEPGQEMKQRYKPNDTEWWREMKTMEFVLYMQELSNTVYTRRSSEIHKIELEKNSHLCTVT